MIDGGFFAGKYMGFDIVVEGINLNVTREEYNFKWLRDILKKEFPYASIPFLLKSNLKVLFWGTLNNNARTYTVQNI